MNSVILTLNYLFYSTYLILRGFLNFVTFINRFYGKEHSKNTTNKQ